MMPGAGGRVYPGYGTGWVRGGAIPGTHQTSPRVLYYTNLKAKPYPRPNEGFSEVSDEVSQIDLRMDPQIDPE